MTIAHLHQTVAVLGGYEFLRELESAQTTALSDDKIEALMLRAGVEDPASTLTDFLAAGLLSRYGKRIGLSTFGIRTSLLLDAVNGGDLREIYHRLGQYDNTLRRYELIREGMTTEFLRSINERPGFSRLYFCSPWISLDSRQQRMLAHAIMRAEKRGHRPDLFVICRPAETIEDQPPDTIVPFQDLDANIFLNQRLHTKLYIREPDRGGGYSMAIVGSQNLTKSQYLELGIRINADSVMVNQLIGYFWKLVNASVEVQ